MAKKESAISLWKVVGIVGLALAVTFGGWMLVNYFQQKSVLEISEFDVKVQDKKITLALPTDSFDYTLYGTTNINEWLDYEVIETGNDLSRITAADLDTSLYTNFVVKFNGTVAEDEFDDDLGDRTYYERWAELTLDVVNTLDAYQQSSDTGIVALNSQTLAAVAIKTGIIGDINVTFVLGSNASQKDAAYVFGFNYETQDFDRPNILVNYNDTVTADIVLSIQGTTRIRVNSTAYMYSFNELNATPLVLPALWGGSATHHYSVDSADLYYGETVI